MGSTETILSLKAVHQAELDKIEATKAPVQSNIQIVDQLASEIEAEKLAYAQAEGEKKFAEGHAAGVEVGYEQGLAAANQAGGTDKIYSDAEMNEFLAAERVRTAKQTTEEVLAIVEAGHAQENSIEISVVDQIKAKLAQ